MEEKDNKRIISLGIQKQDMYEDIIYVDFKYDKKCCQTSAVAYSNEKFKFHCKSSSGNLLTKNEKKATTKTGTCKSVWHRDYNNFIKDLAESNNGEVVDCRLIRESSKLVSQMSDINEMSKINLQDF
jgi:hypothetical protein